MSRALLPRAHHEDVSTCETARLPMHRTPRDVRLRRGWRLGGTGAGIAGSGMGVLDVWGQRGKEVDAAG